MWCEARSVFPAGHSLGIGERGLFFGWNGGDEGGPFFVLELEVGEDADEEDFDAFVWVTRDFLSDGGEVFAECGCPPTEGADGGALVVEIAGGEELFKNAGVVEGFETFLKPEDFEREVVVAGEGGFDGVDLGEDVGLGVGLEFEAGEFADFEMWVFQEGDEFLGAGSSDLGLLEKRGVFASDTPDSAVGVVAVFVTIGVLGVADDGVVKVGDVEGSVGAEDEVGGAENFVFRADEDGFVSSGFDGSVDVLERGVVDLVGAEEVAGEVAALPILREVRAFDKLGTAAFVITEGVAECGGCGGSHGGVDVVDVGVDDLAAAVELDGFADGVVGDSPRVGGLGLALDGEAAAVEVERHDGGVLGVDDAVGSFELATVEEGFREDEVATWGAGEVAAVVGVGVVKAAEVFFTLVGDVVAIGVLEVEDFSGDRDEGSFFVEDEAIGEEEIVGEDSFLVSFSVVVGVFEDEDEVVCYRAGKGVWVARKAGDPEAAFGIELHLQRVDEFGEVLAGGEAVELEVFVDGEVLEVVLRGLDDAEALFWFPGGHFGFKDGERWEREGFGKVSGLFPDGLVELVGERKVVRDFGGVLVVAGAGSVVADAVGGVIALGHFVGLAGDEFLQGEEAGSGGVNGGGFDKVLGEKFSDFACSEVVEMEAVGGVFSVGVLEEGFGGGEEVDELHLASLGGGGDGVRVELEVLVSLGGSEVENAAVVFSRDG